MSHTRRELLAAAASRTPGPVAALRAVLAAQSLSLACYERVIPAPSLTGASPGTHAVLVRIAGQERAHVAATRAALARLGADGPRPPATLSAIDAELAAHRIGGRPGQLRGPLDALGLLQSVERVAVGAAYEALAVVTDPGLSLLLAQAMASDSQHQALVREHAHPGDIADAIPYGVIQGLS